MSSDNKNINCLIIDDEPLAQKVIETYVARIPSLNLLGTCGNAIEAFEQLHKHRVDLIFLDINMPVVSGLNFLRSLKDPPAVILTTAYTEYALEGFELDVVDYLVKPISYERFLKSVQKAMSKISALEGHTNEIDVLTNTTMSGETMERPEQGERKEPIKNYFFVKADGKLVKINYADILYIEGMKDYLKIHLKQQMIITHSTMKAMEESLPTDKFIRVHKSYIISLNSIKTIAGNIIHLDTERVEIPLGNSYKDNLLRLINQE